MWLEVRRIPNAVVSMKAGAPGSGRGYAEKLICLVARGHRDCRFIALSSSVIWEVPDGLWVIDDLLTGRTAPAGAE